MSLLLPLLSWTTAFKSLSYYAPINVNPMGEGGECGQGGGDLTNFKIF